MTPEETIREALERLKAVPSRHGGVPTYPAFAALDALVRERDELREVLATMADWDAGVEAERARSVVLLPLEEPRPATRSATKGLDKSTSRRRFRPRPAFPQPP